MEVAGEQKAATTRTAALMRTAAAKVPFAAKAAVASKAVAVAVVGKSKMRAVLAFSMPAERGVTSRSGTTR
jgi:hypothetical protein